MKWTFKTQKSSKFLHQAFKVGVILKGIDGVLEVIGGLILLFASSASLHRTLLHLTQGELAEDPTDIVANALSHLAQQLSSNAKLFGAFYLLSHGAIKIGLVVALLKKKLWAYPASIAFLWLFVIYQIYRVWLRYSLGMLLLTILDVIVISLIWQEYRHMKNRE